MGPKTLTERKETIQDYLFFSSTELMEYFHNNIREKDLKTQIKRLMEMARVFMGKKDFALTDLYSLLVLVRNRQDLTIVEEVLGFYFKQEERPVGVMMEVEDLEETADVEIEFSAFSKEKTHLTLENCSFCSTSFSAGVAMEQFVHCSGVRPTIHQDASMSCGIEDAEQQTKQCLQSLQAVLQAQGSSLSKVYVFIVYLLKEDLIQAVEKAFADMNLDGEESVKEVVIVSKLAGDWLLEISCSALR